MRKNWSNGDGESSPRSLNVIYGDRAETHFSDYGEPLEALMAVSPELDAMLAQIRAVILHDSEGFFDSPKENENLQITARIACEFYLFLRQSGATPDLSEADYMAGTIRSGLDWFFSIAQTGSILTGLNLQRGFGQELPRNFLELRLSYDSTFQQLRECTQSAMAIGLLLSLLQIMLLFMTVYFPSFSFFSNESGG